MGSLKGTDVDKPRLLARPLVALLVAVVWVGLQGPALGEGSTRAADPPRFLPASAWHLKGYSDFDEVREVQVESPGASGNERPGQGGFLACEASRGLPADVPHRLYAATAKRGSRSAEGAQHIHEAASREKAAGLARRLQNQVRNACLKEARADEGPRRVLFRSYGSFDGGTSPRSSITLWGTAIKDAAGGCDGTVMVRNTDPTDCPRTTDAITLVAVGHIDRSVTVLVLQMGEGFSKAQWRALLATTRSALQLLSPLSATL